VWRRIFSSGKRGKYFRSGVDFQTDGTGEGRIYTAKEKSPMGDGGLNGKVVKQAWRNGTFVNFQKENLEKKPQREESPFGSWLS